MAKQQGTVYQQLNKMLNLDGFGFESEQGTSTPQSGGAQPKIIIKGDSPQDIQRKGIELQQKQDLQSKFFKTSDHGFQKAMQYEAARLPAYLDYEGMEYYPIIASALDLFMEEATTIGSNGNMLNIYSDKDRIKTHLEELFYDVINVNVNLPFWTRNLPIKHDSMIPLLDGTEITIKELSEKIKKNPDEEIWTYSVQDDTKNIVAGKIVWCDLTRKNSEIIKVTLDDGTYVETTPDHEFMLRNGSYIQAQNLKKDDSLMPFYTDESKLNKNIIDGYERVYNPLSRSYKYTHKVVAHELHRNKLDEQKNGSIFDTHHKDFNKKNNHPNNLERLTRNEHLKLHRDIAIKNLHSPEVTKKRLQGIDKYLRSDKRKKYLSEKMSGIYPKYFNEYNNSSLHDEHNIIRSESMLNHWSNPEYKKSTRKLMQLHISDDTFTILKDEIISLTTFISKGNFCEKLKNNIQFVKLLKESNTHIKRNVIKSINTTTLERFIDRQTGLTYLDLIKSLNPKIANTKKYIGAYNISNSKKQKNKVLNHKVVSVEVLDDLHDAYCMEVVGKNGEHDRHNFPICSKDNGGNHTRNGVFLSNCKYGDNFVYLLGEKKKGLTHVKQMVNYEIERIERLDKGKQVVKFKQRETGDEFNIFEIAHFRLLGHDKYLPYGSCLLSDTYIKTNKGIKEIKDIKKGDVVISFDKKTQTKTTANVLDTVYSGKKECFRLSTKHNFIDATKEHKLLTLNNKNEFTYKFVEDFKLGDSLIINNEDNDDKEIKINKKEEFTIDKLGREYHYWNNIENIPDYVDVDFAKFLGFMFGDGWISNNNSPSIALGEHKTINLKYVSYLEKYSGVDAKFYKNNDSSLEYSQAVVGSKMLSTILKRLGFIGDVYSKKIPNWLFTTNREIREAFLDGIIDADGSLYIDKWDCLRYNIELSNKDLIYGLKYLVQSLGYKSGKISSRTRKKLPKIKDRVINSNESFYFYFFKSKNKQTKKYDTNNRITDNFIIEPITSIENRGYGDTYDIHVDNDNHNFYANNIVVHNSMLNKIRRVFRQLIMAEDAMLTYRIIRAGEKRVFKIDVGNIDEDDIEEYIHKVATRFKKQQQVHGGDGQIDYRFNIMGNDEDFFIPVRNANVETGIDTLAGAQNLDQIHDIEYLRDNLFTGLGVPKPFLGFQEAAGDGKNMAQMDVRFLKKVNRIQQAMIQELNKIAIIHLFLLGFDKEDLGSFTLTLANPSTQQELLNAELFQQQASVYAELTRNEGGIAAMSHTKAKRVVLNMSDKDIIDDLKMQRMERAIAQELQDSPLIIRKTGVFDDVDEKYGDPEAAAMLSGQTGMEGGGMDDMGGGFEGIPEPMGGGGGDFGSADALPPVIGQGKGFKEDNNVIFEDKNGNLRMKTYKPKMSESTFNGIVEKIVYGDNKKVEKKKEKKRVIRENIHRNHKLNETALNMVNEIDSLLSNTINEEKKIDPKIIDDISMNLDLDDKGKK